MRLWASLQYPWLEFKSTVYLGPGSISNSPCVDYPLALQPWPLFSSLLYHPRFQMVSTLPEPHMLWTSRPDSTLALGVCMPGFTPKTSPNHLPREVLSGPGRCPWMGTLNSSSVSTCHQSPRECMGYMLAHTHFHRSTDGGILSDEGSLLSGDTPACVQLTTPNQYHLLSDDSNMPTRESLQHPYAFTPMYISHFHLKKLFSL